MRRKKSGIRTLSEFLVPWTGAVKYSLRFRTRIRGLGEMKGRVKLELLTSYTLEEDPKEDGDG